MLVTFDENSRIIRVKLLDSTSTVGAGKTGLAYNTSGLIISTIADVEASPTVYTVAANHIETISTLGTYAAPSASCCRFKEVDATNHPGLYEIHLADARYSVAGAKSLIVSVHGATGLVQCDALVELPRFDVQTAQQTVALAASQGDITWGQQKIIKSIAGEGALHIVNAHGGGEGLHADGGAAGQANYGAIGVYNEGDGTGGSGTYNRATGTNGIGLRNAAMSAGGTGLSAEGLSAATYPALAEAGADGDTLETLSDQLDAVETDTQDIQGRIPAALTANGNIKASLVEILTTALTETAGLLAAGFKKFFNVGTPTGTLNSLPDAVPGASGGLPTTDGTKVSQTVDLTAGQTIAATVAGDVGGKVLGGGAGTITGTGARVVDANGNALATQTSVDDLPTNAELTSALAGADDAVLAVLTAIKGAGWTDETLKALKDAVDAITLGAVPPTVEEIDTYLSGVHGDGSWEDAGGGGGGSGTLYGESGQVAYTYTVYDVDGSTPLADADVYVSSDAAGLYRSQSKRTDSLGRVLFQLNTGTVYFWRFHSLRTFSNPDTETVT